MGLLTTYLGGCPRLVFQNADPPPAGGQSRALARQKNHGPFFFLFSFVPFRSVVRSEPLGNQAISRKPKGPGMLSSLRSLLPFAKAHSGAFLELPSGE